MQPLLSGRSQFRERQTTDLRPQDKMLSGLRVKFAGASGSPGEGTCTNRPLAGPVLEFLLFLINVLCLVRTLPSCSYSDITEEAGWDTSNIDGEGRMVRRCWGPLISPPPHKIGRCRHEVTEASMPCMLNPLNLKELRQTPPEEPFFLR